MRDLIKTIGTHREVARALGVSQRSIAWWASGDRFPPADKLVRLLGLAGVVRVHVDGQALYCYATADASDDGVCVELVRS